MRKKCKMPPGKICSRISIVHGINSYSAWSKEYKTSKAIVCTHLYGFSRFFPTPGGAALFRSHFSKFLSAVGCILQVFCPFKVPFSSFCPFFVTVLSYVCSKAIKTRPLVRSRSPKMRCKVHCR